MEQTKEEIKQAVKNHLAWDARVQSTSIEISVYKNPSVVQLDGVVNNLYEKMVAKDDALSIPGVSSVVNNLKVQYDNEMHEATDEELQRTIHYILTWDKRIDASHIKIKTVSGIVTLEGSVDALWKKQIVEDQVQNLNHVIELFNNLNVVPTKDVIDEEIAEEIRKAFKRSKLIKAGNITVMVENGYVTLNGYVSSLEEKRAIEAKVLYTSGITGLQNNLKLKEPV